MTLPATRAQRIRAQYIRNAAEDHSISGGGYPAARYSVDQWIEHLTYYPLSQDDMSKALKIWRQEFEQTDMHAETYSKVKKLREKDTRASKEKARTLSRGSFKVWQKNLFGRGTIAKYFLKYYLEEASQEATLKELHESMLEYRSCDKCSTQVERSRKRNPDQDPQKKQETEIEIRIGKLRSLKRKMRSRQRQLNEGKLAQIPKADRASFAKFTSGELDMEIDKLLVQHGYGQSHVNPNKHYEAPSLFNHV